MMQITDLRAEKAQVLFKNYCLMFSQKKCSDIYHIV
jgi:hypothetical protein